MEMEARADKRLALIGKGLSPGLAKGKASGHLWVIHETG
jgi:hypothetical protein